MKLWTFLQNHVLDYILDLEVYISVLDELPYLLYAIVWLGGWTLK